MPTLRRGNLLITIAYVAVVLGGIGLFLVIRSYGEQLSPSATAPLLTPARLAGTAATGTVGQVLMALAAVVIVGRALAYAFARAHQPPVIGEVLAGVVLGPSLLGAAWPAAYHWLLPAAVVPLLNVVAQVGVVLYMFLVGLELDLGHARQKAHATVATSHSSIIVPFVMGTALALYLYPRFSNQGVSFTAFAMFIGTAMAVTAFPVLARILSDVGKRDTRLGALALTCAAVDDVTAWCLLAMVVGISQARLASSVSTIVAAAVFVAVMFGVVRPLLAGWADRVERGENGVSPNVIAVILVLSAAVTTETIGVHALFGAFVAGAIVPHGSRLAKTLTANWEHLISALLLPAFFAIAGIRTELALLSTVGAWAACLLIIVVAAAGKIGGTFVAARATGMPARAAAILGVLMNTRGLMQLIVLNMGLDLGVISPAVFSMMVVAALVHTMATAPLIKLLVPSGSATVWTLEDVPRETEARRAKAMT